MNYRFYIYKQAVLTNFDKYDLSQYSLLRQITNNAKWSLKIERDNDFLSVIRVTFNGDISVKGDDFAALIALEGSQLQYCVQIQEQCAGVWREKWKGYFSYFDYKVDLDICQLSFNPSPFDAYTVIYDQMDIERNVLAADSDWTMKMDGYEYNYEETTQSGILVNPTMTPASWYEYPGSPAGNKFYLFSQTWTFLYATEQLDGFGYPNGLFDNTYEYSKIYRRDFGYSASNVTPPSADVEWVLDPDYTGEYSPGIYRWVRPYLSMDSDPVKTYTLVVSGLNTYEELITVSTEEIPLLGLKRLSKVLEYFAGYFNLTYESHFFNDTPCPMGGTSLYWTMIQQISNFTSKGGGETATKGMMKLKDLLSWIRDTFNVYWYIDSAGKWRLEHRKYFDWGLSYTSMAGIELDLNLYPDNVRHLSRYEWSKPNLFRFEKLEMPYNYSFDWTFAKIEYPQLSIIDNQTRTVNVDWNSDIIAMYDAMDELPKQGWVFYNVNLVGAFYKVINTVGAMSGASIPNARFSPANLMRDLWTWGRLLPTGNVNGVATTFDSIEKLKKQVELTIPQCCTDIDYNGVFHTDLGNGILDAGELDSNGNLKISLKYE